MPRAKTSKRAMRNWEFRNYKNQDGDDKRELYITGEITEWDWWGDGDETTPDKFEEQLYGGRGDVDIWISSPGGDVFAAAKIYNSITQYKGGKITAYIYGFCASAATVITMAANEIYMSPTALMLIHNPSMFVWGESADMKKSADMLDSVKETIINAYEQRTGLSREEISDYMNREKAFDSNEAIELGFVDGLIESEQDKFSTIDVTNSAMVRFYNSVHDWKLAFQATTEKKEELQEEKSMAKDEKLPEIEDVVTETVVDEIPAVPEVKDDDETTAVKKEKTKAKATPAAVVDVKDFEAVVNELKTYKEQTAAEIAELREYKARQEAEIKAQDIIGLPGISDERRIEIARTADEKLFEELKAMAVAMNELTKPIGVVATDDEVSDNKEEAELRKKIKDYMTENNVSESEAYYAVVNGGK